MGALPPSRHDLRACMAAGRPTPPARPARMPPEQGVARAPARLQPAHPLAGAARRQRPRRRRRCRPPQLGLRALLARHPAPACWRPAPDLGPPPAGIPAARVSSARVRRGECKADGTPALERPVLPVTLASLAAQLARCRHVATRWYQYEVYAPDAREPCAARAWATSRRGAHRGPAALVRQLLALDRRPLQALQLDSGAAAAHQHRLSRHPCSARQAALASLPVRCMHALAQARQRQPRRRCARAQQRTELQTCPSSARAPAGVTAPLGGLSAAMSRPAEPGRPFWPIQRARQQPMGPARPARAHAGGRPLRRRPRALRPCAGPAHRQGVQCVSARVAHGAVTQKSRISCAPGKCM